MLSERQLEAMLDVFRKRTQKVNEEYLIRMGKHLRDIGKLTASDVNRLVEMKRLNTNMQQVKHEIAKAAQLSQKDVETAFIAAAEADLRFAYELYGSNQTPTIKANPTLERILKAQAKITNQELSNLSQTTLFEDGYRNAVDVAVQSVQTGVVDYNTAIRRAMKDAAQDGLRIGYPDKAAQEEKRKGARVYYPSGKTRRLDSAVRQNVLDGVRAINQNIMEQVGKEFGADGIELSAHLLCAEDHLPYQGHQMSNETFKRLQNRLKRPFGMWNCRHNWFPIVMGVTRPAHTPEELRAYAENSNELIEIDGVTKTRYQWTQEQRRIETAIRYQKDIAVTAKASGDMMTRRECQHVIQGLNKKYADISEKAGLRKQHERTRVDGFTAVKPLDELKNPAKYGIINAENGKTYMRIYGADGKEKYRYLQTDAIQKLDSSDAIAQYFTYTDKDGDTYHPITDAFGKFKLDVQKEIAEGIEWGRTTFSLKRLPKYITKGKPKDDAFGSYNSGTNTLTFNNTLKKEHAFVTAVHEMTHYANHAYHIDVDAIFRQAMKNLGIKMNTKAAKDIQHMTVGLLNRTDDWKTPEELVAYSLERHATNRPNKLSTEICRLWLERIVDL